MSLTKQNPAFDRMLEEARERDELSYETYSDELFHNRRKGLMPPQESVHLEEQKATHKPGHGHNTTDHANDHRSA
jgi:hypothetical protein